MRAGSAFILVVLFWALAVKFASAGDCPEGQVKQCTQRQEVCKDVCTERDKDGRCTREERQCRNSGRCVAWDCVDSKANRSPNSRLSGFELLIREIQVSSFDKLSTSCALEAN